jgi:hypothetical protein
MPRRPRPAKTERSEHLLRVAVNDRTAAFDEHIRQTFHLTSADPIEWISPVAADGFAEYYDEAFLAKLKANHLDVPLRQFWPKSGPRWDGLARTKSGKLILLEAKAYVEEAVDYTSSAGIESMKQISAALKNAKSSFHASKKANWEQPFYQYANRLAHLFFLRKLNREDAYLLFVCFADAPDVPKPCSAQHWEGAIRIIERTLGLGSHPFRRYVGHIIWSVPEMLATHATTS